ncbi:hypothetical protein KEM52_000499 [Ascosphaera acerosa]|nr:hypothetical protein KEM52_000499 [Ascosphaera acerosa]
MAHQCHDEHAHGHGHGHGDGHSHDHSDDVAPALQHNLYQYIDFARIVALNEQRNNSGRGIVKKTWDQRFNAKPMLKSDVDEQLLISIPWVDSPNLPLTHDTAQLLTHPPSFTGHVKLHSVLLYAPPGPSAPRTLKLFRNMEDLDFASAETAKPTQQFDLAPVPEGEPQLLELPVKRTLFGGTTALTLFFEDNQSGRGGDEEVTKVGYLGFRGDFTAIGRAPVSVMYEAAANPKDHAVIQGLDEDVGNSLKHGRDERG